MFEKYAFPVVVAPPLMVRPPVCVPSPIVVDALMMTARVVVGARYAVAPLPNTSHACPNPAPVASVPHERTPNAFAFTSHDAAFKLETMRLDVDALPVIERFVSVEVAFDDVAVKLRATTSPTTESAA